MGSPVLATGRVSGVTGNVPGPPEGSGGLLGGATNPGGLRGPSVGRDQPLGGLVRLPQEAQGAWKRGRGKTLGSDGHKAHLGRAPLLSPFGRPPDASRAGRHP